VEAKLRLTKSLRFMGSRISISRWAASCFRTVLEKEGQIYKTEKVRSHL